MASSGCLNRSALRAARQQAIATLRSRGEQLCYTSQILGEFWNVCTRPTTARGGLGTGAERRQGVPRTVRRVRLMEQLLVLLPETLPVHEEWRRLLEAHAVTGVQVHDAGVWWP